jgi:pimeloyl-ACP methyl ester carboxylesterase
MTSRTTDYLPIEVVVALSDAKLGGSLAVPDSAVGLVAFAHGSGSSRYSSRNRYVAEVLHRAGLATLLFDLLTANEAEVDALTRALRFDIPLLTRRLSGAVDWLSSRAEVDALPVGLFGASTGAAAALGVAAARPGRIAAVVSRGGRPDLAGDALRTVAAPTLLIVGGEDDLVIGLNESAARRMHCVREVCIVRGATHLFEEPGTLERVAELARDWFLRHCAAHVPV